MLRQLRQDGDGVSDDRLPADPKIAGGVDAECGRYPYMVSLRDRNDRHRCGGILVHPMWVMTAAHCVDPVNINSLGTQPVAVIGACGLDDEENDNGVVEEMLARETIVHSNYTGDVRDGNDIALIHLPTPSRHIFAGLPQSSEELQGFESFKVIGWGRLDDGSLPQTLQEAPIDFVRNNFCATETEVTWGDVIIDSMVCAFAFGGEEVCEGDSGGPLIKLFAPDGNASAGSPNLDIISGITSFGEVSEACGKPVRPSVFTRVASYRVWIDGVIALAGGISSSTPMPTLPTMGANESAPAINETTPSADESTPDADESVAASPVVAAPAMAPVPSTGDGVDGLEEGGLTPEDQESVNQILWIGAFTGDVGLVEQAIAGGADVDVRLFDFGDTPLTAAALNGHANVTVVLLEAGADPNRPRSFDGITPLFGASQEGHIEVVTALLEGGADANAPIDNDSQLTALVTASQFGRADVVDALLAAGADPNMLVQDFFAPLHFSTLTLGDPSEAIATALLDAGADIDAQGGQGWTPLVLSSFFGNVGVTEILVGRGANVSVVSTAGNVAEELVCLCTELGEQSDIFRCPEGGCEFPETAEVIRELLAGA
ncbi:unnamed protein product [Ostreobium quekettii]|uniref:Peptidase S1 domain-containing protein n=1 Tax=Ostreobium quekettii TaxID=121088 RepID=A0A8S1IUL5_9CHLO|nr:unnamed protein product [Ostreobium quekettii]